MDENYRSKPQLIQELQALRKSVQRYSEVDSKNKKLLEAYWKNMEHFRLIAESAGDAIWTINMRMKPTYISPSITQLLGYTVNEALYLNMEEIFTHDSYKDAMNALAQEVNKGLIRTEDIRPIRLMNLEMVHKDGSIVEVEIKYSLLRKPGERDVEILAIARNVAGRKKRIEELQNNANRIISILENTIIAIAMVGETKDPYTAGHQRRVSNIAFQIANALSLPEEQTNGLRLAALIHDIGKVAIPTEILINPGRLSEAEMAIVKLHPTTAYTILKNIQSPWPVAEIVYQHHERIDGSGYPRGLSKENILVEAKILVVADVFEAMLTHRPYRPAFSMDIVLQELKQNRGKLYDIDAVDACLKLMDTDPSFLERVMKDELLSNFDNLEEWLR